jgi:hypothetical protein
MDRLPQRDDLIYKEIEEFQDYELTNCVAYEMMIRNNEFEKKYEELNYYYNNIKIILQQFMKKYNLDKLRLNEIIESDIEKIVNFRTEVLENKRKEIYLKFGMYYFDDEFNKLPRKLLNGFKESEIRIGNNLDLLGGDYNELFLIPSRPRVELKLIPSSKIKLNLNLPKEELISYITKIKDEYDKNNSIIKTPLELLGETLEKSDNKKTPKKPKASVYADWFYIYDYWKYEKALGKTDKDIFVALEVENNVPYKEDMLRKIRDKMKYFIDDLGYKELITGVKNI